MTLVREALELAAGSAHVRVHLHPDDHQALGGQVQMLVDGDVGLGERRSDRRRRGIAGAAAAWKPASARSTSSSRPSWTASKRN